jgi:hypothetical protein
MPAPVLSCARCGKPGTLRHFPGPIPYSGVWCDRCTSILAVTWYFTTPLGWIHLLVLGGIVGFVAWFVVGVAGLLSR